MISRLEGILLTKDLPTILIDVHGVGYEVDIPMTTFYDLPEIGKPIVLHTHLAIREDAHQLFGFLNELDRRLFRELIKVNGIGGRSALAILSGMSPVDFINCILQENIALLIKVPGIGKKTAERLIIEMRDRLKSLQKNNPAPLDSSNQNNSNYIKDEALAALVSLGYRSQDAQKMIDQGYTDNMTAEELIRTTLKKMM
jgi:Holliday junction DNA helicase RuvA